MPEVLDLTLSDDEDTGRSVSRPQFNNDLDAPNLTIVNGKGFWKAWTRSFKTTLLKLLDLIDNSVDGATIPDVPGSTFVGRVHIYPDVYEQSAVNRKGKKYLSTTGLCIRNNSPRKIVPLCEALVVHNTTKVEAGEIGENGVGLKQACAALCDLSFILVKNGSNADIELGIVARSLQREDGPYLPAFQLSNEKGGGGPTLRKQMVSIFSQTNHDDVAQCIARYGAEVSGGDPSLSTGIDALCERFDDICHGFYGNDYVFEVILNNIRHDQSEGLVKRASYAQQKITVTQLVKELQREIPKTYLHIPDSFDFIVGTQKLGFKYWQERLVELATFSVTVGPTVPWQVNFEVSDEHPDAYALRLFLGFDRERIADPDVEADTGDKKGTKNASLYFYSRQSGRLIKSEPDARHALGLSTGSSNYGSALTIIIDDVNGNLPLHPTKQDVSFGLENKGVVHEVNLYAWVGAVTKFYYNYHLRRCGGSKKGLSAKVSHHVDSKLRKEPLPLGESQFTSFDLTFEQYRNNIRVDHKLAREFAGPDTHFRIFPDPENGASKGEGKKRAWHDLQKKQPLKGSEQQSLPCNDEQPPKRSRLQPFSHHKESDLGFDEERAAKLEDDAADNELNHGPGCIDLCESSDEEGGAAARKDHTSVANIYTEEDSRASSVPADKSSTDAGPLRKTGAPGTASPESSKILELEREMKRLRGESYSKIESLENEKSIMREELAESSSRIEALENENKALRDDLAKKKKIISVLKRRLGA